MSNDRNAECVHRRCWWRKINCSKENTRKQTKVQQTWNRLKSISQLLPSDLLIAQIGGHQEPLKTSLKKNQKRSLGRTWNVMSINELPYLSGGFKYVWNFHPCVGEDEPILTIIFFKWVGSTTNQVFFFENTYIPGQECADCDAAGPTWASWTLGLSDRFVLVKTLGIWLRWWPFFNSRYTSEN